MGVQAQDIWEEMKKNPTFPSPPPGKYNRVGINNLFQLQAGTTHPRLEAAGRQMLGLCHC